MITVGVTSVALLGVSALVLYQNRSGQYAGNLDQAGNLSRQLMETIRLNHWYRPGLSPSGLIDSNSASAARPALSSGLKLVGAYPLQLPDQGFYRYIRVSPQASGPDYRAVEWRVEVEVLFYSRSSEVGTAGPQGPVSLSGRERSVSLVSVMR